MNNHQKIIGKIINKLDLKEHPEGGYFSEIYRCHKTVTLDTETTHVRNLGTSIYYMLKSGQVSKFHKLKSDEIWYFHSGSPLKVYMIDMKRTIQIIKLGDINEKECQSQIIFPAGTIFGAEVILLGTYSLIGCAVMPGFDFNDFELIDKNQLNFLLQKHNELIERLT